MCSLLCNFLDSLLGPRQLVARNKEMKNYRRENLKRHLLDFCVHASLVLSTFSLVVRTELKTEPSRGNRALPHQKSICPIPHCDLWQLRSRCRTSKFAEQEKKPQLAPHGKQQRSAQLIRKVGIEKVDEPDLFNARRESRDFRRQLQTQQELASGLDVVLARRFDLPPPA